MTTGQQISTLVRASVENDRERVISVAKQIMASERHGSVLQKTLEQILNRSAGSHLSFSEIVPQTLKGLVIQQVPSLTLDDVALPDNVLSELSQFIEERQHAQAIRDAGLKVPNRLLISGPPGNGKTTLAGAIADTLSLPFLVVDYSNVVSGLMGETGAKITKIFRGVSQSAPILLFLDEMDTVLTERNRGSQDVGEIARVVSTLLLEIDRLPDHVVLIGATNHEEMLDRAVVRRFDHHWQLPVPDKFMRQNWFRRFAKKHTNIPLLQLQENLIVSFTGSLSDLEREIMKQCRRWVIESAAGAGAKQLSEKETHIATTEG